MSPPRTARGRALGASGRCGHGPAAPARPPATTRRPARRWGTIRPMGIIDRAKRAISSNVNAMLDKAEDPRKMVELTLDEMGDQMKRAKQDVIAAVAAERQLRKKCDELKASVEKWEQRAM